MLKQNKDKYNRIFKRYIFIVSLPLLFLTSCKVGPDPKVENFQTDNFDFFRESKGSCQDVDLKNWWTNLEDKQLNKLIDIALNENYDLKIALEKIEEAKGLYGITKADLFFRVDMEGSSDRRSLSQNFYQASYLGPGTYNFHEIGFTTSWEIDLFGKIRRAKESAYFMLASMDYNKKWVYLSLISDVAKYYLSTISLKKQMDLFEKQAILDKTLFDLIKDKYESGISSGIELNNILSNYKISKSNFEEAKSKYKASFYAMRTLFGKSYNTIEESIFENKNLPYVSGEMKIPSVLPSTLLTRRYDIMKAQYELFSSISDIGVAKADFFPRFSLTGNFLFQSDKTKNLISAKSQSWKIGPNFTWPIWDFGRIACNVKAKTAFQKQTLYSYEQTIVNAFKEVETALVTYFNEENRLNFLEKNQVAKFENFDLDNDLYSSGIDDLFTLYQNQKEAITAEIEKIRSHENLLLDLINLYKSLGGEW